MHVDRLAHELTTAPIAAAVDRRVRLCGMDRRRAMRVVADRHGIPLGLVERSCREGER